MPSTLTSRILESLSRIPVIGILFKLLLRAQYRLWAWKPGLVERLSDFLPIGAASTIVQATILFGMKARGTSTIQATALAVGVSVFVNYVANRQITWKERFSRLSFTQNVMWFLPLFLVFVAFTPTVFMKTAGIPYLESLGLPVSRAWLIFEGLGVVANFLGADRLSFGLVVRLIERIEIQSPRPSVAENELALVRQEVE